MTPTTRLVASPPPRCRGVRRPVCVDSTQSHDRPKWRLPAQEALEEHRDLPGACDSRQPRARVRLCRGGARPVERARADGGRRGRDRRRGCRRARGRRRRTSRSGRTPSSPTPRASGSASPTGSRSSAGSDRRRLLSRSVSPPRAPTAGRRTLLAAGLTLESHADNLAAALVGGVTLTWEGRIARIAETLPLAPVALVPRERTSTEASRRSLPSTVPHADAAANAGRAALLAAGAAKGDAALFAAGLDDRLHEPYRASDALESVRADLPEGARGATLSGSGPTVIVWADDARACAASPEARFPDHDVLELAVSPRGVL